MDDFVFETSCIFYLRYSNKQGKWEAAANTHSILLSTMSLGK